MNWKISKEKGKSWQSFVYFLILAVVYLFTANVIQVDPLHAEQTVSKSESFLAHVTYLKDTKPASNGNGITLASMIYEENDTNSVNSNSLRQNELTLAELFKRMENSVVQIQTKESNGGFEDTSDPDYRGDSGVSQGSGFVYSAEGHIVTNNHVVEGSDLVDVIFATRNIYTAKVIGTDAYNDIAVLQILDDYSDEPIVPVTMANSSKLEIGQEVVAIGNPFGLSNTMTSGIISQLDRLLPVEEALGGFSLPNVIQTDAAINPGNSGGPLLNLQGEVVGINTSIHSGTGEFSGIGFVVPSNSVTRIVPHLIENGHYDHPWLGFSGYSLTPDVAETIGLPRNFKGVLVESVEPGGPADKAGVIGLSSLMQSSGSSAPDIIIAIDNLEVKGMEDVLFYLEGSKSVGDNTVLSINRNGQIVDLQTILGPRPSIDG